MGQPVGYPPGTSTREERLELLAAESSQCEVFSRDNK